jgi:effector-binding domain-containing protein
MVTSRSHKKSRFGIKYRGRTNIEFDEDEYAAKVILGEDQEKVEMRITIMKVKDEEKHVVEVTKFKGDYERYCNAYKRLVEFFGGHVNGTKI